MQEEASAKVMAAAVMIGGMGSTFFSSAKAYIPPSVGAQLGMNNTSTQFQESDDLIGETIPSSEDQPKITEKKEEN